MKEMRELEKYDHSPRLIYIFDTQGLRSSSPLMTRPG